jgi:hypothetical protein
MAVRVPKEQASSHVRGFTLFGRVRVMQPPSAAPKRLVTALTRADCLRARQGDLEPPSATDAD